MLTTIDAVGYSFINGARPEALEHIRNSACRGEAVHFHLVNAFTLACAENQPHLYRVLSRNDGHNLMDGTPLSRWARYISGASEVGPVRGPSLFKEALTGPMLQQHRHFFLGSTQATLSKIRQRAAKENPNIVVAGAYSPPYGSWNDGTLAEIDRRILESRAEIVWVGLGTPLQDVQCARISEELGVVTVAVDAAFDYFAGEIQEAPKWLHESGFEWVHRLVTEPRRLWRRYLIGNLVFARLIWSRDIVPRVLSRASESGVRS